MAKLKFEDISFEEDKDKVKIIFLKIFYCKIDKKDLENIGKFKINKNEIEFNDISEQRASKKFNFLLEKGFKNLTNKITGRKTIYIHKNSGVPLIGSFYFGIIDRGTNIIEIRPLTGCNLNCIYCSVDEGPSSKRVIDFVVEKDYLIQELEKVIKYKKADNLDIHINSQGEPLLYAPLFNLISDIKKFKQVKIISVDTNGTLLTKDLVDKLAKAGLTRINLSLNSLNEKNSKKIANCPYNLKKVIEITKYIPKKLDLIIAPVLVPDYNDDDMSDLIEFSKKIGAGKDCPPVGIQNFLNYKYGRNPVKQLSMDRFFKKMKTLEKKHDIELMVKEGFQIIKTKELPKPFKRKEIIEAQVVMQGRLKDEKLAVSKDRVVSIPNCSKQGKVKARITRAKHNIFFAELV